MGYYAHMTGSIIPKSAEDIDKIIKFIDEQDYWGLEYTKDVPNGKNEILVWNDEKYHEEDYYELLKTIKDLTSYFALEFVGEDYALWAFFRDETDPRGFVEKEGRVVYD